MASFFDRLALAEDLLAKLAAKNARTPVEQRRLQSLESLLRHIDMERVGRGPYPDDNPDAAEIGRRVAMRVALDDWLTEAVKPF